MAKGSVCPRRKNQRGRRGLQGKNIDINNENHSWNVLRALPVRRTGQKRSFAPGPGRCPALFADRPQRLS